MNKEEIKKRNELGAAIVAQLDGEEIVALLTPATRCRDASIVINKNNGAFTTEPTTVPGFATFIGRFTLEQALLEFLTPGL